MNILSLPSRRLGLTGGMLALALFLSSSALAQSVDPQKAMERLNAFAALMLKERPHFIGYPINQDTELQGFYKWYQESGLYEAAMNNVGDPYKTSGLLLNTHAFEQEVIDYYGLAPDVHPEQGELAHVLIMQHVSRELLDGFIADMKKDFGK